MGTRPSESGLVIYGKLDSDQLKMMRTGRMKVDEVGVRKRIPDTGVAAFQVPQKKQVPTTRIHIVKSPKAVSDPLLSISASSVACVRLRMRLYVDSIRGQISLHALGPVRNSAHTAGAGPVSHSTARLMAYVSRLPTYIPFIEVMTR